MQLYSNTAQFTPQGGYTRRDTYVYTNAMADIPNLNVLVEEVEKDLLSHIYANLKTNEITAEQAQTLAQEFLKLLPFKDKKDLLEKLNTLGKQYREAQEVYVKLGIPLEEQERQQNLDLMHKHIVNGELDKALEVAKSATKQDNIQEGGNGNASSTSIT